MDIKFDDPPIGTYKPNRCGSYPFMNIAQDFGLPYGVVLMMSDYFQNGRQDQAVYSAFSYVINTCPRYVEVRKAIEDATRSNGNA
jgi:hypothetical protein